MRIIKSAGENLLIIIDDILDLSKIEAGMLVFEKDYFSIKETFKSLHAMLMGKAKEKNIELVFTCDEDVSDVLLGDRMNTFLKDSVSLKLILQENMEALGSG